MSWLSNVLPWLGLGTAGILGVLAYFSGFASVLRIVASVVEALSPIVKSALEVIGRILADGLMDILDSMKTIITVITLCALALSWQAWKNRNDYNDMVKDQAAVVDLLNQCRAKLPKGTKILPSKPKAGGNGWFPGWPFGY